MKSFIAISLDEIGKFASYNAQAMWRDIEFQGLVVLPTALCCSGSMPRLSMFCKRFVISIA